MAISSLQRALSVMFSQIFFPRSFALPAAFSIAPVMPSIAPITCSRLIFLFSPPRLVASLSVCPAASTAALPRFCMSCSVSRMLPCASTSLRCISWYAFEVLLTPLASICFSACSAFFTTFRSASIFPFSRLDWLARNASLSPVACSCFSLVFSAASRVFTLDAASAIPCLNWATPLTPIFTLTSAIFSHPYSRLIPCCSSS